MLSSLILTILTQSTPIVAQECAKPVQEHATSELLGLQVSHLEGSHYQLLNERGAVLMVGTLAACEQQRLTLLVARHGTGNINWRFATLGGMQWWADEYILAGWRLQRHIRTGHWRLLDRKDVRQAWGSYEACRTVLERERLSRSLAFTSRHLVLMLPGIGRSKHMFAAAITQLATKHCDIMAINYPSTRLGLDDHSKQLARLLSRLQGIETVTLIGHSMGGLVIRGLFSNNPELADRRQGPRIQQCVFVFTPNQGAYKAQLWSRRWWYRCLLGPAGQQLCPELASTLPIPTVPCVVIAGGQGDNRGRSRLIPGDDDGTVAVNETYLPGADQYIFPVGHTFGINDPQVLAVIDRYL